MVDRAEKNDKIIAITAAMPDGTGLSDFAKAYPTRFFDVGIAEEHALTFACGLATEGYIPVFAVYSTFAQRAFDQLIHDAALQDLHIIIALDRAGLVANDGATHHGIFDTAFIPEIPNVTFRSPLDFASLEKEFDEAIAGSGVQVIRYPKSGDISLDGFKQGAGFACKDFGDAPKTAIVTYGRMIKQAVNACERVNTNTRIIALTKLNPIDFSLLSKLLDGCESIVFVEEGIKNGGVSQRIAATLAEMNLINDKAIKIMAIDNIFPEHGSNGELFKALKLSTEDIATALTEVSK